MPKYYRNITETNELDYSTGSGVCVSSKFYELSSNIISSCSFLQNTIQRVIYASYGAELKGAKGALNNSPNPKARFESLCSFRYETEDKVVAKVFNFSHDLFLDLYDLRNVLSHEIWSSSNNYPDSVLFSSLDENSRLLMASGKLWHQVNTTSQDTFFATIRFIRSVKLVTIHDLQDAISDVNLCNWALMIINNILDERDQSRKEELRRSFFVFRGTSHLFDNKSVSLEPVEISTSKSNGIS